MRQRGACAQHDAGEIDGHQLVPFVERRLLDSLAVEHPGVVHEDVELAELLHGIIHCGFPARLAGDVEMDIERVDLLGELATRLIEHIADRHPGAGLGHQGSRRPPMPRAAPDRNATLPSSLFMTFLPFARRGLPRLITSAAACRCRAMSASAY
jgi:hypothetical protein